MGPYRRPSLSEALQMLQRLQAPRRAQPSCAFRLPSRPCPCSCSPSPSCPSRSAFGSRRRSARACA
eukprot:11526905-Alexandrium_andersonii.AAC.1